MALAPTPAVVPPIGIDCGCCPGCLCDTCVAFYPCVPCDLCVTIVDVIPFPPAPDAGGMGCFIGLSGDWSKTADGSASCLFTTATGIRNDTVTPNATHHGIVSLKCDPHPLADRGFFIETESALGAMIDCGPGLFSSTYVFNSSAPKGTPGVPTCSPFDATMTRVVVDRGLLYELVYSITEGPCAMGRAPGEGRPATSAATKADRLHRTENPERRGRKCLLLAERVEVRTGCAGWNCEHRCGSDRTDVAEFLGGVHPKHGVLTTVPGAADGCQGCPGFLDGGPFVPNPFQPPSGPKK